MGVGSVNSAGTLYALGAAVLATDETAAVEATAEQNLLEPPYAFGSICEEGFLGHSWGRKTHLFAPAPLSPRGGRGHGVGTHVGAEAADERAAVLQHRFFDVPDLIEALRASLDGAPQVGGAAPLQSVGGTAPNGSAGVSPPRPTLQRGFLTDFFRNATLVLSSLQTRLPRLAAWSRAFARTFGLSCEISLYVSPPGSQALPLHNDQHDNFVAQVAGEKAWKVWDLDINGEQHLAFGEAPEIAVAPFRHTVSFGGSATASFDGLPEPSADVRLQPGSLLYIPRGSLHVASTSRGSSSGEVEAAKARHGGTVRGASSSAAASSRSPPRRPALSSSVHLTISAQTQSFSYALAAYHLAVEPSVQEAVKAAGWDNRKFRQALMRRVDHRRDGAAFRQSLPLGWSRWAANDSSYRETESTAASTRSSSSSTSSPCDAAKLAAAVAKGADAQSTVPPAPASAAERTRRTLEALLQSVLQEAPGHNRENLSPLQLSGHAVQAAATAFDRHLAKFEQDLERVARRPAGVLPGAPARPALLDVLELPEDLHVAYIAWGLDGYGAGQLEARFARCGAGAGDAAPPRAGGTGVGETLVTVRWPAAMLPMLEEVAASTSRRIRLADLSEEHDLIWTLLFALELERLPLSPPIRLVTSATRQHGPSERDPDCGEEYEEL